MTDLRSLRIAGLTQLAPKRMRHAYHDVECVAAVLRAVGRMSKLVVLHLELPVRLTGAAVLEVSGMLDQLLLSWMVPY
jgi:hypothetical protein